MLKKKQKEESPLICLQEINSLPWVARAPDTGGLCFVVYHRKTMENGDFMRVDGGLMGFNGINPLLNFPITMERSTIFNG